MSHWQTVDEQTAERLLNQKYSGSPGCFIEYYIDPRTKAHVVKVTQERKDRRGEGDTIDDAYKNFYENVLNKKLSKDSNCRQEVHNHCAQKGGDPKEDVNDQGKATVTARYLVAKGEGKTKGTAFYAALRGDQ